jgi:hypothetical protein
LGQEIGSSATMHDTNAGGLAIAAKTGQRQSLLIFHEQTIDHWGVSGNVDSASDLGLAFANVSGLDFAASYEVHESFTGANWVQAYSHGSSLSLQYRWIVMNASEEYGFQATDLLFPVGTSRLLTENNLRGHLVSAQYNVPLGRAGLQLDAAQLIPITGHSRSSSTTVFSSGGHVSSSGGWSLSWSLIYPLP